MFKLDSLLRSVLTCFSPPVLHFGYERRIKGKAKVNIQSFMHRYILEVKVTCLRIVMSCRTINFDNDIIRRTPLNHELSWQTMLRQNVCSQIRSEQNHLIFNSFLNIC